MRTGQKEAPPAMQHTTPTSSTVKNSTSSPSLPDSMQSVKKARKVMASNTFIFCSLILVPLLCGIDVRLHTPPCSTVVHLISRQSLLFDTIIHFVQPSSLRYSSLTLFLSSFLLVLSFSSPFFLRSALPSSHHMPIQFQPPLLDFHFISYLFVTSHIRRRIQYYSWA